MPKFIITGFPHGNYGITRYYCVSATQGENMIHAAYSMAKRFDTRQEARDQKEQLVAHWKGLDFLVREVNE